MSKKIMAILLAFCMLLSYVPTPIYAVTLHDQDENLVVKPDEKLVVSESGEKTDPYILEEGVNSFDLPKRYSTYFEYTAPTDGTLTVTISTSSGKWCYTIGTSTKWDTQPDSQEMNAGDSFIINIRIYTSSSDKYGGAAGTVTLTVNFVSAGGETPEPECEHTNVGDWVSDETNHWKVCGDCGEKTNVAAHSFGDWENGKKRCECGKEIICDHSYTNACDTDCNICGATREVGDHQYDNACDAECNICKATREVAGHQYDNDCDATCNSCGAIREVGDHNYVDGVCSNCGAEDPNYCDHIWVDATCVTPKTCSKCGSTDGDALGHDMGAYEQTTSPTCTQKGQETSECSRCDYAETRTVDALGHDMGAYKQTTPPTCTEKGQETSECSRCDYKEYRDVKATGHNYVDGVCSNCGAADPNYVPECQHDWADATCDEPKTCSNCGSTEGQALGHTLGAYVCTKDPTCNDNGLEIATCVRCEYTKTRYVKATGHSYVDGTCSCGAAQAAVGTVNNPMEFAVGDNTGVAPSTGTDKYYYFVFHAVIDGTVSIYSEGTAWRANVYIYNADGETEEDGRQTYNPNYDGSTITRELQAGQKLVLRISPYVNYTYGGQITVSFQFTTACAHSFETEGTEATCLNAGYMGYTCSVCDTSYAEILPALGHNLGDYAQTKAPTCTEDGEETASCSRCDYTHTRNIDALGHTEETVPGTPATCTEPGMTDGKKCSVCGEILTAQEEIPALGHTPGEAVKENEVAPSCTDAGSYESVIYCTVCSAELSRTPVSVDAKGHTEETVPGTAATCTEPGLSDGKKCTVCGEVTVAQTAIPAKGHTEETVPGTAATCTEPGMTDGKKCSVCGEVLAEQEVIPAKDHTEETVPGTAATCTEPGLSDGKKCSVCGEILSAQEVIPAKGHTPGADADCTTAQTCTVCGEILADATGHNYVDGACSRCGDAGIYLRSDIQNALISGQLYVYTATEDVRLNISISGMKDSAGKTLWSWVGGDRVQALINGVPMQTYSNQDITLKAGQTVTVLVEALDGDTYTATAKLTESPVSFLELGENDIVPGTDYSFIAEQNGTLYLSVIELLAGDIALDSLDGLITVEVNGFKLTAFNTTYNVAAGDEITVTMTASVENASGSIWLSYEKAYDHPAGSKKNPLNLPYSNCPESTVEISAGGTVWYQLSGFESGYVLRVTGENAYILVGANRYDAVDGVVTLAVSSNGTIQIGNAGDENATFAMETYIPVGHKDNYDTLKNGQNTVDIPAGGTYYYQFTAQEDGKITVAVSGGEYWRFFISHFDAEGVQIGAREDHRGNRGDTNTVELEIKSGESILLELTTYYDGSGIGGAVTADFAFVSSTVAQINGIHYASLHAAIEAAVDGDTIVLLADIFVDEDDWTLLDGQYKTFFRVTGKSITIDLNGKTVYGDARNLGEMLVGMFSTELNGHLILKDSSNGSGTVQVEAGADNLAYALVINYDASSSIEIYGGNYILDYSNNALVDTRANECIKVYGGNFRLGNVGTLKNGSPWIFNAKGQNTAHVLIYGGTYNADIQHQYWLFESEVVKEKALTKSEDPVYGTIYTVVDAVCYVTERHFSGRWYTQQIGYATLQEAVDACVGTKLKIYYSQQLYSEPEEIVLLKDIVLEQPLSIIEDKEFTLDLNGKTISQSKECTEQYAMIINHGKLTIKDSAGGGKISFNDTGAGDATYTWGSYTIANFCGLTVEGGTIEHLGAQPFGNHMICAIYQAANPKAVTTICGGTISAPNFRAVRICSGTLVISGGTFDGQVWVDPQMEGVAVTITDGKFEANGTDEKAIFIGDKFEVKQNITITITENEIDFGNISVPADGVIGDGDKKKPVKKP